MRQIICLLETVDAAVLYHTTSNWSAVEILQQRAVRPKSPESFVSFSEKPLPHGDIAGRDVTLAFRANALATQVEPVEYSDDWFIEHPGQSEYIAGEGWKEQFELPDDIYDEDGFADEDAEDEAYQNGRLDACLVKVGEDEHISKVAGRSVTFRPQDFLGLIVYDGSNDWRQQLDQLGYQHASIEIKTRR